MKIISQTIHIINLIIGDAKTLVCEKTWDAVSSDPQVGDFQVAVAINNNYIVSLSLNGTINLFKETDALPVQRIQSHQASITTLFTDPQNNTAYTGASDGVVCSVNTDSGEATKITPQDKKVINNGVHTNKVTGTVWCSHYFPICHCTCSNTE